MPIPVDNSLQRQVPEQLDAFIRQALENYPGTALINDSLLARMTFTARAAMRTWLAMYWHEPEPFGIEVHVGRSAERPDAVQIVYTQIGEDAEKESNPPAARPWTLEVRSSTEEGWRHYGSYSTEGKALRIARGLVNSQVRLSDNRTIRRLR